MQGHPLGSQYVGKLMNIVKRDFELMSRVYNLSHLHVYFKVFFVSWPQASQLDLILLLYPDFF